jgi:uncharacterized protein (DUF302 family)
MDMPRIHRFMAGAFVLLGVLVGTRAVAEGPLPRVGIASRYEFATTLERLQDAVAANGLGVVTRANAQNGARSLGVSIPGNQVWGVFGPRFAVRMLKASVEAGLEAPLRLYIVESPDGKVTVSYVKPSVVFAPYGNKDLDAMARELDPLFERIVAALR